MGRRVTHDGRGSLQVRFPFDRRLVDLVKGLPHRRWNATERYWSVPDTDVVALVDLLRGEGFEFDAATRELYRRRGGAAALREGTSSPTGGPTLPGLFDAPPVGREARKSPSDVGEDPTDLTVSRLNERVRALIETAFPDSVWLVGEISGFNKSAHRRHVSFELAERNEAGDTVSKIPATLFESTRREIEAALRRAGDPFRLEDEIEVRVRVRVELYVPWGQYRVVLEDVDLRYTLGEAARRREEIVRRLIEAGWTDRNSVLPFPALPLRVGLVTSLGSDAYNDVLRTLEESGFAFRVTAHGARVQGRATEPSVLNALDWFRSRAAEFDVVLICRGGGSRTDLTWFDTEELGRTVADFPLPVVVGIGHEQDRSVLDAVARSCKTPTATADLLVRTVRESRDRVENVGREILDRAARRVAEEKRRQADHGRRLTRAAGALLREERGVLRRQRRRTVLAARLSLRGARQQIARWATLIPRHVAVGLERQRSFLDGVVQTVVQSSRRGLQDARRALERQGRALGPWSFRLLRRERERLESRRARLRSVDPRIVLGRGYSILRLAGGELLTRADRAPAGTRVRAELRSGRLLLRSEGKEGG